MVHWFNSIGFVRVDSFLSKVPANYYIDSTLDNKKINRIHVQSAFNGGLRFFKESNIVGLYSQGRKFKTYAEGTVDDAIRVVPDAVKDQLKVNPYSSDIPWMKEYVDALSAIVSKL